MSPTPSDTGRDTTETDTARRVSALVAVAGLLLAALPFLTTSPFAPVATDAARLNNLLLGSVTVLLAGHTFYRLSRNRGANVSIVLLTSVLGIGVAFSAYLIEFGSNRLTMTTIALGLFIAALSAYNARLNQTAETPARDRVQS